MSTFYPYAAPVRVKTNEALNAIIDESLRAVQIVSHALPLNYVDQLRAIAKREDIHLLASAPGFGRLVPALKLKMSPYCIGNSWFDERAVALIEDHSVGGTIPQMTLWIHELLTEARETSGITAIEARPSKRTLAEIPPELRGVGARALRGGRGRQKPLPTGRPPGRPLTHYAKGRDCACGDLWPCPRIRNRPRKADRLAAPAWAQNLPRALGVREPAGDQPAAGDEPRPGTAPPSEVR